MEHMVAILNVENMTFLQNTLVTSEFSEFPIILVDEDYGKWDV